MTYSVLASSRGASMFVAAGWPRTVDHDAIAGVLARYGLAYSRVAGEKLEFIAATELPEGQATALAHDLEAMGLHTSVIPTTQAAEGSLQPRLLASGGLSALALLGGSATTLLGLAMFTVIPGVTSQVATTRTFEEWLLTTAVLLGTGLLFIAWPTANLWTLGTRSGRPIAGTPRPQGTFDPDATMRAIRDLAGKLPTGLAGPLLERAEAVVTEARRDPQGEAAQELHALLTELHAPESTNHAKLLKRDLALARDAVRESGS
ncbi:MAG: hypothetical protein AAGA48_36775 [Myxococcota bacterium]